MISVPTNVVDVFLCLSQTGNGYVDFSALSPQSFTFGSAPSLLTYAFVNIPPGMHPLLRQHKDMTCCEYNKCVYLNIVIVT